MTLFHRRGTPGAQLARLITPIGSYALDTIVRVATVQAVGGLLIALLLAPIAASVAGYLFVKPRSSAQGLVAVGCAIALLVSASWLALRYDDSVVEAAIALALTVSSLVGLWKARSAAGTSGL